MLKKKFYLGLFILVIVFYYAGTQNARAHSPSSMILNYSLSTGVLSVSFSHSVSDPNNHYIEKVEVKLNGVTEFTETYTSQPTASGGSYQYNLTATETDRIQVTLTCNQGGSLTLCILGGGGACPDGDGGPQIPGYLGLLVVLGISVIAFLTIIHRKLKINTS